MATLHYSSNLELLYEQTCDRCRVRKVKCDKKKPSCKHCTSRKEECTRDYVRWQTRSKKSQSSDIKKEELEPEFLKVPRGDLKLNLMQYVKHESSPNSSPKPYPNDVSSSKDTKQKSKTNDKVISVKGTAMKAVAIQMILSNSIIDTKKDIAMLKDGTLDYNGNSPMGFLVTKYLKHKLFSESEEEMTRFLFFNGPKSPKLIVSECLSLIEEIAQSCLNSYFAYFHYFVPLVDKDSFLSDLDSQPKMLIHMMCAIGSAYLPHIAPDYAEFFTNSAIVELKKDYTSRPTLGKVATYLLLAHFQHSSSQFQNSWIYLGVAIRIGYALGLDKESPKSCSPTDMKVRSLLWAWCHILDKTYSFTIGKPWLIIYQGLPNPKSATSSPQHETLTPNGLLSECSLLFTLQLCAISHLLSFVITQPYLDSSDSIAFEMHREQRAHEIKHKLDYWHSKLSEKFKKLEMRCDFDSSSTILKFKNNLDLIYFSTLLQLFQPLASSLDRFKADMYIEKCRWLSEQAINITIKFGHSFNFAGTTYRFYCLSVAVMFQLMYHKQTKCKHPEASLASIQGGIAMLRITRSQFKLASECLGIFSLITKFEDLSID